MSTDIKKPIVDNSVTGTRSVFRSKPNWLGSADFGRIVPFYWKELIGTDKVESVRPRIEMQMLPFASPTFGEIDLYVHYFFVPTRLLMDNFMGFYSGTGAGRNYVLPHFKAYDLCDYYSSSPDRRELFKHWTSLGLPPFFAQATFDDPDIQNPNPREKKFADFNVSALPFRAYNHIWWDYYRDCEVYGDDNKAQIVRKTAGGSNVSVHGDMLVPRYRSLKDYWISDLFKDNGSSLAIDGPQSIIGHVRSDYVDPINETASNLRYIEALTRISERMSLSGKRQIDMLFSRYGIKPEWSKLDMCQYVGGSKASVLVSDIVSQADTVNGQFGEALGAKAGNGYCALSDLSIDYTAAEPGILMGVFSVMPKIHYVQGIGRQWTHVTRDDMFTEQLQRVGQISLPRREVGFTYYNDGFAHEVDRQQDDQTFAFTQPYYEYKRDTDVLAGDFMYYHNKSLSDAGTPESELENKTLGYLQSMGLYFDYPSNREFSLGNLTINRFHYDLNKIFFYNPDYTTPFDSVDDHFHVNITSDCTYNRPMDGYAVPTLETTSDPHASKTTLATSTKL